MRSIQLLNLAPPAVAQGLTGLQALKEQLGTTDLFSI